MKQNRKKKNKGKRSWSRDSQPGFQDPYHNTENFPCILYAQFSEALTRFLKEPMTPKELNMRELEQKETDIPKAEPLVHQVL